MKKFNKALFIISTWTCGLLLIPSYLAAFGEDEGTLGTNIFWVTFSKLFYILRFPTHTLLWSIFSSNGWLFILGLGLNCVFYGLVIERLFYVLKNYKKRD
jgi:hypothetical protein